MSLRGSCRSVHECLVEWPTAFHHVPFGMSQHEVVTIPHVGMDTMMVCFDSRSGARQSSLSGLAHTEALCELQQVGNGQGFAAFPAPCCAPY